MADSNKPTGGAQYGFEPWIPGGNKSIPTINKSTYIVNKATAISNASGTTSKIGDQGTSTTTDKKTTDVSPKDQNNDFENLKREFDALKGAFYKNNFQTSQDFTKKSKFTSVLIVPTLATAPSTCAQGSLYCNSGTGKLYICSATNTWTIVGTQS